MRLPLILTSDVESQLLLIYDIHKRTPASEGVHVPRCICSPRSMGLSATKSSKAMARSSLMNSSVALFCSKNRPTIQGIFVAVAKQNAQKASFFPIVLYVVFRWL